MSFLQVRDLVSSFTRAGGSVRYEWIPRAENKDADALSNLASMLALLGYPFLLEPWSPTRTQAIGWSLGYALFVGLCAAAGWTSIGRAQTPVVAFDFLESGTSTKRS